MTGGILNTGLGLLGSLTEFSSPFGTGPLFLLMAFALDLVIGDPGWLPHPVRMIGRLISVVESSLRRVFSGASGERLAGVILVLTVVSLTYIVTLLICRSFVYVSDGTMRLLSLAVVIYLISTTIAARELVNSSRQVIESIKKKNLVKARHDLGMIVGRDTGGLDDKGTLKATIETLAENLSDGVIAPLFYLLIGGLPLAMAYKAVNTLDSMVGYLNERYLNLGWASARLDDIMNFIPARITGWLVITTVFLITLFKNTRRSLTVTCCSFKMMLRDGRKHLSPNSGIPEAAIAGALGVRLGGPSVYSGVVVEKPFIGEDRGADYLAASELAVDIVRVSSLMGAGLAVVVMKILE